MHSNSLVLIPYSYLKRLQTFEKLHRDKEERNSKAHEEERHLEEPSNKAILDTEGKGDSSALAGDGLADPPAKLIDRTTEQQPASIKPVDPLSKTPRKNIRQAQRLLTRLTSASHDDFSWTSTGEVKIEAEVIKYSNIAELIAYACRKTKRSPPVGASRFRKFLKKHQLWPRTKGSSKRERSSDSSAESRSSSSPEPTLSSPFMASVPQRSYDTEEHLRQETGKFGSKLWYYIGH